ncbi:MAG: TonB family protein [Pyrinomonadaceae bacterium]
MHKTLLCAVALIAIGLPQNPSPVRLDPAEGERLVSEKPEPVYPHLAKMLKLQETVTVEANVSAAGAVVSARYLKGNPVFKTAALTAVKQRRYKPHLIDGKAAAFVTTIDLLFSLGVSPDEYERQQQISRKYFEASDKCRDLLRGKKLAEAEAACQTAVQFAEQLLPERLLEKMGAYEMLGHVLLEQRRFREALAHYTRSLEVVGSKVDDTDAEIAQAYGNIAIAHHALRELDEARAFYRRAERTYQNAIVAIDDEWFARRYRKSLRQLLELHLVAAEQSGATAEADEIRKLMGSLP